MKAVAGIEEYDCESGDKIVRFVVPVPGLGVPAHFHVVRYAGTPMTSVIIFVGDESARMPHERFGKRNRRTYAGVAYKHPSDAEDLRIATYYAVRSALNIGEMNLFGRDETAYAVWSAYRLYRRIVDGKFVRL